MLKVIDKINFNKVKGKSMACVYRFTRDEWRCVSAKGDFVHLRYKAGILALTSATSEYDLGNIVMLIGSTVDYDDYDTTTNDKLAEEVLCAKLKYPPLNFKEIKDFLEWKVEEENIWDCFLK